MSNEEVTIPFLAKSSSKKDILDAWRSFISKLDSRMVALGNKAGELSEILRPNYVLLDLLKSITSKMQSLTSDNIDNSKKEEELSKLFEKFIFYKDSLLNLNELEEDKQRFNKSVAALEYFHDYNTLSNPAALNIFMTMLSDLFAKCEQIIVEPQKKMEEIQSEYEEFLQIKGRKYDISLINKYLDLLGITDRERFLITLYPVIDVAREKREQVRQPSRDVQLDDIYRQNHPEEEPVIEINNIQGEPDSNNSVEETATVDEPISANLGDGNQQNYSEEQPVIEINNTQGDPDSTNTAEEMPSVDESASANLEDDIESILPTEDIFDPSEIDLNNIARFKRILQRYKMICNKYQDLFVKYSSKLNEDIVKSVLGYGEYHPEIFEQLSTSNFGLGVEAIKAIFAYAGKEGILENQNNINQWAKIIIDTNYRESDSIDFLEEEVNIFEEACANLAALDAKTIILNPAPKISVIPKVLFLTDAMGNLAIPPELLKEDSPQRKAISTIIKTGEEGIYKRNRSNNIRILDIRPALSDVLGKDIFRESKGKKLLVSYLKINPNGEHDGTILILTATTGKATDEGITEETERVIVDNIDRIKAIISAVEEGRYDELDPKVLGDKLRGEKNDEQRQQ